MHGFLVQRPFTQSYSGKRLMHFRDPVEMGEKNAWRFYTAGKDFLFSGRELVTTAC